MNSTKQSCNDKKYNVMPYFTYTLRQSWQQLMLFLVLILLVMILPCVIYVGNSQRNSPLDVSLIGNYSNQLVFYGSVGIFLSCAFGLYSGMTALSYVNSNQNITCRHSFPLKRGAYFAIEPSVCLIYFTVSILAGFAAVYAIMSVLCKGQLITGSVYLAQLLAAFCGYILVYATTLFAAGLTGTGVARFLMTFVVMLLPVVLYTLVVESIGFGSQLNYFTADTISNSALLNTAYYESGIVYELLCPIYYIFECVMGDGDVSYIITKALLTMPHTAVLTAGAYLLHMHRRTEDTGKTIIWKPVFALVKYLVIFTGTILGMFVFVFTTSASNSDLLNIIFGAVIGFVLTFMAANCVMYRSTRALFKGIKPALVLAAAVLVFVIAVPMNKLGLCVNLYSPDNTQYIVLQYSGVSVTIEDGFEKIVGLINGIIADVEQNGNEFRTAVTIPGIYSDDAEVQAVLDEKFTDYTKKAMELEYQEKYGDGDYDLMYEGEAQHTVDTWNYIWSDSVGRRQVYIYQKPKFGVTLAIKLMVPLDSPLWSMYIESEEYAESMDLSELDSGSVDEMYINLFDIDINLMEPDGNIFSVETREGDGTYYSFKGNFDKYRSYVEEIIDSCEFDLEKYREEPIVGSVEMMIYDGDGIRRRVSYPICAGDLGLINAVGEMTAQAKDEEYVKINSAEEAIERSLIHCTDAVMVDSSSGEARHISMENLIDWAGCVTYLPGNGSTYAGYVIPEDMGYVFMAYSQSVDGEYAVEFLAPRETGSVTREQMKALYDSLK